MERSEARAFFAGVVAMAPMATGGNLPYRRLCREFGAVRTCSEMILADKLVKGGDRPLLRRHESETDFGVQLTGKRPEVMAEAAVIAVGHGAQFIDLNFGCPIDLIVRRGAGAALLRKPRKLAEVVAAVRAAVEVPLSVKIRLGYSQERLNAVEVALAAVDAGADAIGVHGRTRAQRYRLSADWTQIDAVARAVAVPVLGNGDLLTPWDLRRRRAETAVSSFLVARGALVKPWVFRELADDAPLAATVPFRWRVMRRYLDFALEYFGDDERGTDRARRFFLWHLGFWNRYHPWTEGDHDLAWPDALLQQRNPRPAADPELELLAADDEASFETVWRRVLDSDFPSE